MTDAHAFVVQLDHLVRLLVERPAELDDQKLALHQLHAALAHGGDVLLAATPTSLAANGEPQDGPPAAADGLRGRLVADGVRQLAVSRDASSADLLVTARALATTGGLVWLELDGVRVDATPATPSATPRGVPAVMRPTPILHPVAAGATPAGGAAALPRAVPRPVPPRGPAPARISGASAVSVAPMAAPAAATAAPVAAPLPAPLPAPVSAPAVAVGTAPGLVPTAARVVAPVAVAREAGLVNRGDAEGDAAVLLRPTPTRTHRVRDMADLVAGLADVATCAP